MLYNAWAVVLVEIRLERGLTREQAAADAGVATSTWYRWENGPQGPGGHQLVTMARGLGVSEDDLALRYAEVLLRHYERRRLEAEGAAEPQPGDGRPPSLPEGAGGPGLSLPAVQGLSPSHGLVVVDLNDLVDKLARHRAVDPAAARPRRLPAQPSPGVIRRGRRRKR